MKITFKPDSKFKYAITYDIFNWGWNITAIMFGWSINHTYTMVLAGLFLGRWAADYTYRYQYIKEQAAFKKQQMDLVHNFTTRLKEEDDIKKAAINQQFGQAVKNTVEEINVPFHEETNDVEDADFVPPVVKKDILQ